MGLQNRMSAGKAVAGAGEENNALGINAYKFGPGRIWYLVSSVPPPQTQLRSSSMKSILPFLLLVVIASAQNFGLNLNVDEIPSIPEQTDEWIDFFTRLRPPRLGDDLIE
jgi:hypothetical protein